MKEKVKAIALEMAKESGLINLTRKALSDRTGIPDGSFLPVVGCTFSEIVRELVAEMGDTATHAVSKSRANPALRKKQILEVAINLAVQGQYLTTTRAQIATMAGVSEGLVTKYFKP